MQPAHRNVGRVYLVGAGPGDPGLITVRGVQCLQKADVVLYDYLSNSQLLEHTQPACERICVGKHGGGHIWTQDEINEQIVKLSQQNKTVVRLKGGDPAIFARGAEEMAVLREQGIPFEVVPGITAALAAGSYTGVPLTHRDHASAVAFVTGQERPEKEVSAIDYQSLAHFPGTLVFYMGVTTADMWTTSLINAGKPANTPALIVRRCSHSDQQVIYCELGTVAETLNPATGAKIRPPVVVVVGDTVRLGPELAWFGERPLFGRTVMVTRPAEQAEELAAPLRELGAGVLIEPMIAISEPADYGPVDGAIDQLADFDWIVFSSANGVRYFLDRVWIRGLDGRSFASAKLAAVGKRTAEELAVHHLQCDLLPDQYDADALLAAIRPQVKGKRVLLVRASRGREVLAEQLTEFGAEVVQVAAYQHNDAVGGEIAREKLASSAVAYTTVTSSATARSLAATFGGELSKTKLVSMSPITSQAIRDAGFEPAAEAPEATMQGIVQAILQLEQAIGSEA